MADNLHLSLRLYGVGSTGGRYGKSGAFTVHKIPGNTQDELKVYSVKAPYLIRR